MTNDFLGPNAVNFGCLTLPQKSIYYHQQQWFNGCTSFSAFVSFRFSSFILFCSPTFGRLISDTRVDPWLHRVVYCVIYCIIYCVIGFASSDAPCTGAVTAIGSWRLQIVPSIKVTATLAVTCTDVNGSPKRPCLSTTTFSTE
jgi:hypothetical protein